MRRFNLSLEKTPVKASIRFATFAATSFLLLAASPARADVTWNVQQGDWSVATNWSGGALPTSTDNADIFNGGTATITTTGDTCSTLSLGNTAGSGAINMTSGSFTVSGSAFVGFSGTGTFTQSGGTNNVTYGNQGAVYLGYNVGSNGTYSLGSSGLLSAWSETVGNSGTGNFTQSGGTNTISRNLYIGESAGSNGTYNLSGGLLSVGSDAYNVGETLGYNGMGAFIQSGGTNTTNILYSQHWRHVQPKQHRLLIANRGVCGLVRCGDLHAIRRDEYHQRRHDSRRRHLQCRDVQPQRKCRVVHK